MNYELVSSLSDLENYLGQTNEYGYFGMDTEASSLNTRSAKLAGISISIQPETGIYIPVGHKLGTNLPIKPVWDRIEEFMGSGYVPVFFNAKYDLNVLQVATKKRIPKFEDALELVYLANPDRKRKGLKLVAQEDLNFNMDKFETLFSAAEIKAGLMDISNKAPARCVDYACADSDATLRVRTHFDWVVKEFNQSVKIDTLLIDIIRKIEHNGGMQLNLDYVDEQIAALDARAEALRQAIFRMVGYSFEINSGKQLGEALFDKLGIPSPGRNKNGTHTTRADALDKLRDHYPVVEFVVSYRKCLKAKSSYFMKLKTLGNMGLRPRFNFNMFAAPTFRFAAPGGDPKKDGATGVNIQAVSNGETREIMGVDLKKEAEEEDYLRDVEDEDMLIDLSQEEILDGEPLDFKEVLKLPYVVSTVDDGHACFRETCSGCLAQCSSLGIDVTRRPQKGLKMIPSVRQSFRAPEGFKLVSFDYDRQELVIGANMSQEPRWLRALANGDDLHEMTASAAFGISLEDFQKLPKDEYKRKRGVGKTLNFATFYGATSYTLANKADISQAAADQIYNTFVRNHPTLFNWMNKVHLFARKNGYTTTYFGRRRSLAEFYKDGDRKMMAFGDRSAVNTAIQGTAAEITRIAMVKVDKACKEANYSWKDVKPVLQIHDELAYLVRDEIVQEVIPLIKNSMEFKVKSWQVQLSVGPKVGDIWGSQDDWFLGENGIWSKEKPMKAAS